MPSLGRPQLISDLSGGYEFNDGPDVAPSQLTHAIRSQVLDR